MPMIETLTSAQRKQLTTYQKRWMTIAARRNKINQAEATALIDQAYEQAQLEQPIIQFYPHPDILFSALISQKESVVYIGQLETTLLEPLISQLQSHVSKPIWGELREQIYRPIFLQTKPSKLAVKQHIRQIARELAASNTPKGIKFGFSFNPEQWLGFCAIADFLISALGCPHNEPEWQIIQPLAHFMGWTFEYTSTHTSQTICAVCDLNGLP